MLSNCVLEKILQSTMDCKEIKPVNPKENQSRIFIGRTEAEAEVPVLWPPDVKSWLTGKDPDAGKDWGQEEKGTTEDEMVGWHHQLDSYEFVQAPGFGDGQEAWHAAVHGAVKSWTREWLNWTENPTWWRLLLMTSTNLWETCAWLHVLPLHQNHIYTHFLPHYLFAAVSHELSEVLSPRL